MWNFDTCIYLLQSQVNISYSPQIRAFTVSAWVVLWRRPYHLYWTMVLRLWILTTEGIKFTILNHPPMLSCLLNGLTTLIIISPTYLLVRRCLSGDNSISVLELSSYILETPNDTCVILTQFLIVCSLVNQSVASWLDDIEYYEKATLHINISHSTHTILINKYCLSN